MLHPMRFIPRAVASVGSALPRRFLTSVATCAFASLAVSADDGIDLTVVNGTGPGAVHLQWTGGALPFGVYRSGDPARVGEAANQLGQTDGSEWPDTPPAGEALVFYLVTSLAPPCPPGQTLCPTGCVDLSSDVNNCGGCGVDCDDSNACTNDLCVNSACRQVDLNRCLYPDPNNMDPNDPIRCGPSGCGPCNFATSFPGCASPDTDRDGLHNMWEDNQAIDLNCDGVYDPNDPQLPDSNSRVADIYVKASAMMNSATETFPDLHRPSDEAIRRIVAAFGGSHLTTAPVRCDGATSSCPEGFTCSTQDFVCLPVCLTDTECSTGVCEGGMCRMRRLHFDHAAINPIPHSTIVFLGPVQPACITGGDPAQGVNFYDIKADPGNFDQKKAFFTRFLVFGHFQSCDSTVTCSDPACSGVDGITPDFTTSGLAEFKGNDFVTSLGALSTPSSPAEKDRRDLGAVLHELGHNLGLRHGGPDCDPSTDPSCVSDPNQPRKVNYLSVMNPLYNFGIPVTGVPGGTTPAPPDSWRIDFSHSKLSPLDETCLDETQGVAPGNPPAYMTDLIKYFDPTGLMRFGSTMPGQPIDWNADGFPFDPCVAVNINAYPPGAPPSESHPGAEDWDKLHYTFQCGATFLDGAKPPDETPPTGEIDEEDF